MADDREKIELLKSFFSAKTDEELADKLGVSVFAVRSWKQRGSLPKKYELLLLGSASFGGSGIHNSFNSGGINGTQNYGNISINDLNLTKYGSDWDNFIKLFEEHGSSGLLKKFIQILEGHKEMNESIGGLSKI